MQNLTATFKKIGLVARLGNVEVVETLKRLLEFLETHNFALVLERATGDLVLGHKHKLVNGDQLAKNVDLVIVVGGDGSLLGTVRNMAGAKTPVIGINRGKVGFLTDIAPHNLEQELAKVLSGNYLPEERFLLEVQIWREGKFEAKSLALNEVVLQPSKPGRMISYAINIDHKLVCEQRGDGIIISSPTGSTAYALSAGGPILHPSLKVMQLVPIMPQTLSSRPIVINSASLINLHLSLDNPIYPQLVCDGQVHLPCKPGDILLIKESIYSLKLLHPENHDFYKICRTKLGWNHSFLGKTYD